MRTLIGVTIVTTMWVVAAALVVGLDASNFRPPSGIDDGGMSVPLDQFSARRLKTLRELLARRICQENPDYDGGGGGYFGGGDVWVMCNPTAARQPYRPASAPELPPLVTMPPTRPTSQSR